MKKLLVIIGLICYGEAFSQDDSTYNLQVNQMSLQHFIETCFQENYASNLYNIGLSGICYTRFQITTNGEFKNIEVCPGTNEMLASFIKSTLKKTKVSLNSQKADLNSSEYFVLPIVYNFQKDGETTKSTIDSQALLSFFSPTDNSNSVKFVFLTRAEYTSPFDNKNQSKKISLQKQSL